LCDATVLPDFNMAMLKLFIEEKEIEGDRSSELTAQCLRELLPAAIDWNAIKPERQRGDFSNATVTYGTALAFKYFRTVDNGPHPESELGQLLAQNPNFQNSARWVGEILSKRRRSTSMCLGVVHQFVPNEGLAWQLTLDELSSFFERVTTMPPERALPVDEVAQLSSQAEELPELARECIGGFPETIRLIARRLAELHIALAAERDRVEFAPEEFSSQYQRSLYQSMRKLISDTLYQLSVAGSLPEDCQPLAADVLAHQATLEQKFQWLAVQPLESQRIRCHGDCHLGQLLFSGKDFVFINFQGSPLLSLGERRLKRSPIRDLVSMARSVDYVALSALYGLSGTRGRPMGAVRPEDLNVLSAWTDVWSRIIQQTLVSTYKELTQGQSFAPPTDQEFEQLLDAFTLERLLIELKYELTYRPAWLILPLKRLVERLE
jgi:maltose alpha-D-glucosyltransferase / alpha-amylase